jgi:glycosyltransferase involved in cell wall biosynthesis
MQPHFFDAFMRWRHPTKEIDGMIQPHRSSDHDLARTGKPTVLVLLGAFWPGNDASGPNQSFLSMARALSGTFSFRVVALDRPTYSSDQRPAELGRWHEQDGNTVRYVTHSSLGARDLLEVLRGTDYDVVMLNGFFDHRLTIPSLLLRRLGRIPSRPTILSTRGEFAEGALSLKSGRKRTYLTLARRLGLHRDIFLHATGPREAEDIKGVYPYSRGVLVAPIIRQLAALPAPCETGPRLGPLRLAFLGRITPVKNLDFALGVLNKVRSPVVFHIFGPIQDADYWQECQRIIQTLPSNVSVMHKGEIANATVPAVLAGYDLLLLPTLGENFGHAILDALEAGLPVLISDRTPFQDLERHGAGWSLPLEGPGRFAEAIETIAALSEDERLRLRAAARHLGERTIEESDAVARNRLMLAKVLAGTTA